jgi:two-component system, NtrC family, response regulator AtoC
MELGIKQKQLSTEARTRLMSYNYPGNIRELSNIIESSLIISKTNTIKAEDLALPKQEINSELNGSQKIELENGYKKIQDIFNGLEESLIKEALNTHKDMPNEDIAKLLGTTRRVLESRIKAYNIKK